MANLKLTSLRIFQPAKKKYGSAVRYGILGFCAGVIFSKILGYSYLNTLVHHEIPSHSVFNNQYFSEQDILEKKENNEDKPQISTDLELPTNPAKLRVHQQPEQEDDHPVEFPQPQESDLSRIFIHQTQLKSVEKHQNTMHSQVRSQQHSLSDNSAAAKTKMVIPISTQNPTLINLSEISTKHIIKKTEANELPQVSAIISETKTPVIPSEKAVSP